MQFLPPSQALHSSLAIGSLEWKVFEVFAGESKVLIALEWDAAGEVCCCTDVGRQGGVSSLRILSTVTNK